MLPRLGAQVVEDDVAVGVAGDDHDLSPAIDALAGLVPWALAGISTTFASRFSAIAVVRADGHQPGELTLRARIRLQRHGRETGDLAERLFELREHLRDSRPPAPPARTDACARTMAT